MKKIIASLFCLLSLPAYSEGVVERTQKPVICIKGEQFPQAIKNQYGEVPIFGGKLIEVEGVYVGVYFNEKTKTFTVVEFDKEKTCVISAGTGGSFLEKANM